MIKGDYLKDKILSNFKAILLSINCSESSQNSLPKKSDLYAGDNFEGFHFKMELVMSLHMWVYANIHTHVFGYSLRYTDPFQKWKEKYFNQANDL